MKKRHDRVIGGKMRSRLRPECAPTTPREAHVREELARLIQERVGLDETMALQVADVALDFVKAKLPPQVAPLLEGGSPDLGGLGGALGGMFGNRQA
jgi:hypothetical protein